MTNDTTGKTTTRREPSERLPPVTLPAELAYYLKRLLARPFDPTRVPRPVTSAYRFMLPDEPVDIEIGCGVGLHPVTYAGQQPQRTLVAIEHTAEKFTKMTRLMNRVDLLPKLYAVHANAISWITHMVPKEAVARYFLLYPNPHPKKGDRCKRWYAMPFMRHLVATLQPGGTLTLATNEAFYADEARFFFTHGWGLQLDVDECWQAGDGHQPRTHFEEKYLRRGQVCYNLVFSKKMT